MAGAMQIRAGVGWYPGGGASARPPVFCFKEVARTFPSPRGAGGKAPAIDFSLPRLLPERPRQERQEAHHGPRGGRAGSSPSGLCSPGGNHSRQGNGIPRASQSSATRSLLLGGDTSGTVADQTKYASLGRPLLSPLQPVKVRRHHPDRRLSFPPATPVVISSRTRLLDTDFLRVIPISLS